MPSNTITVYYKNRNQQSTETLAYLEDKKCDLEKKQFSKKPPTKRELLSILNKLDKCPEEIVKKDEALYKKQYKDAELTNPEWIAVLCENPQLIDQPIVVKGDHAIIPENMEDLIKLVDE